MPPQKRKKTKGADYAKLETLLDVVMPKYRSVDSSVYHYTTLEALMGGIIPNSNKDKIVLRATKASYVNDPKEMQVDLKSIHEDVKHIKFLADLFDKKKLNDLSFQEYVYLLSFTENKDFLPMWSMYGKNGNGLVLEFDKKLLTSSHPLLVKCIYPRSQRYYDILELINRIFEADKEKPKFTKGRFFLTLDKMRTKESNFRERKIRVRKECNCESCLVDFGDMLLMASLPLVAYKHKAYEYEKEVRLITIDDNSIVVNYREKNGMVIPYIEHKINRTALKSITIGPTLDFERSKASLEMFLKSRGFSKVKICKSEVPYRP